MAPMSKKPKKMRLDDLLVARGDFPTRDEALRAVMAREVREIGRASCRERVLPPV